MSFAEVNLNEYVMVKLHEEGFSHYMIEHNKQLPERLRKPLEYFKGLADDNGYVKFQMWEFMQMFGFTLRMGMKNIFDLNVLIEIK